MIQPAGGLRNFGIRNSAPELAKQIRNMGDPDSDKLRSVDPRFHLNVIIVAIRKMTFMIMELKYKGAIVNSIENNL